MGQIYEYVCRVWKEYRGFVYTVWRLESTYITYVLYVCRVYQGVESTGYQVMYTCTIWKVNKGMCGEDIKI